MQERRNHYRVLGVQPDATPQVIRSAYRALMQTLRTHPDLGGDNEIAVAVNSAYQVLRRPASRLKYDRQLLEQWDIAVLTGAPRRARANTVTCSGNRRNYYRLLGVQPDAPAELIAAAYRAGGPMESEDQCLLDEAYAVLAEPEQRKRYDEWLADGGHAGAVAAMRGRDTVIDRFCFFCKAPHCEYPYSGHAQSCHACGSPLAPVDNAEEAARRSFTRLGLDCPVEVTCSWPTAAYRARVTELTPAGLSLHVPEAVNLASVVRIRAEGFDAVANVIHSRADDAGLQCGVAFLSVMFSAAGLFVDTAS